MVKYIYIFNIKFTILTFKYIDKYIHIVVLSLLLLNILRFFLPNLIDFFFHFQNLAMYLFGHGPLILVCTPFSPPFNLCIERKAEWKFYFFVLIDM